MLQREHERADVEARDGLDHAAELLDEPEGRRNDCGDGDGDGGGDGVVMVMVMVMEMVMVMVW